MRFKKSFKIALNIMLHSRLRSWLTILGIVIGIAAIVSIVSIGEGAQRNLEQNLNTFNANIITVNPGSSRASGPEAGFRGEFGGGGGPSSQSSGGVNSPKNLTTRDVIMLKSVPNVDQVMGTISGSADVAFLAKTARASIQGVDPAVWKNIVTTELSSGRYLVQGDVNVVVVGGRIASTTFSDLEINRQVSIGGETFKIVGILKESGNSDDSRIFMPIENAAIVIEHKDIKALIQSP